MGHTIVVDENTVYLSSANAVYAIDAEGGSIVGIKNSGEHDLGVSEFGPPGLWGRVLYVHGNHRERGEVILAIDTESANVVWRHVFEGDKGFSLAPAVIGRVGCFANAFSLIGLDVVTGHRHWMYHADTEITTSPSLRVDESQSSIDLVQGSSGRTPTKLWEKGGGWPQLPVP